MCCRDSASTVSLHSLVLQLGEVHTSEMCVQIHSLTLASSFLLVLAHFHSAFYYFNHSYKNQYHINDDVSHDTHNRNEYHPVAGLQDVWQQVMVQHMRRHAERLSNMFVVNATTPAQMFHALRRQLNRPFQKPLVLLAPKYLLHHRPATSALKDFTTGTFFNRVIDDGKVIPCLAGIPASAVLLHYFASKLHARQGGPS